MGHKKKKIWYAFFFLFLPSVLFLHPR